MRFGRALAIYGMGVDCHAGMPPSQPPVPPAPVNPVPVPSNVVASMYAMYPSQWLMGKFSKPTVHTEGDGGLLAGHDWGVGQPHLFTGPVMIVTPSAIFTALGASHKYWIPCSAVQEPVEGGLVNGATGGSGAIAPVGACCLMSTQNCMDVSGAGFNAPTGIGISTPTTRQVGVTCGDIVAGIVSLLTDCLASFASSKLGHDNYEIFMQRFDGTRKCRITFTPGADVLPVFSPDGKYLMWSSKRTADNTTQLFLAKFVYPRYLN